MLPFYERLDEYSRDQSISVRIMKEMGNFSYWHFHQEIEIFFAASGSGKCIVGDNVGHYKANDLVIAGSFLPHDFNYADDNSHTDNALIHFNPKIINGIVEFAPIRALLESAKYGLFFPDVDAGLKHQIQQLIHLEPTQRAIAVFSLLSELSAPKQPTRRLSSIDFSPDTMDERSGKRLNAVVEHITSHQHRPISVEEMASVCNLSPPAFCRWFKQIFKCSFVAYMTERRIENACRLLETSDMSVSRIGDQVGFESYSNFNRAFTKIKNIPPREYRRATL